MTPSTMPERDIARGCTSRPKSTRSEQEPRGAVGRDQRGTGEAGPQRQLREQASAQIGQIVERPSPAATMMLPTTTDSTIAAKNPAIASGTPQRTGATREQEARRQHDEAPAGGQRPSARR